MAEQKPEPKVMSPDSLPTEGAGVVPSLARILGTPWQNKRLS